MNNSLTFVFLLIAFVLCANIFKTWLMRKKPEPENTEELEEALAKVEQLEDRIRVLERIVTENRFDLKNEIDSL